MHQLPRLQGAGRPLVPVISPGCHATSDILEVVSESIAANTDIAQKTESQSKLISDSKLDIEFEAQS